MIWDHFSSFTTNNAILTKYMYNRADPRACRGLSRGLCHVARSNGEGYEILLWRLYVVLFSKLMEKVRF